MESLKQIHNDNFSSVLLVIDCES